MQADAVAVYLGEIPPERRQALQAVRAVVLEHLPDGYLEAVNWGMISYEVPLAASGKTYNGKPLMLAALANQKRHMALYLCGLYCRPGLEPDFRKAFAESGRKLDMGKACVRFRTLDDLDLKAVAKVIAAVPMQEYIELARSAHRKR